MQNAVKAGRVRIGHVMATSILRTRRTAPLPPARCLSSSSQLPANGSREDQPSIEYRQLGRTGMNLALIGMGGSGYGNVYRNFDEKESIDAVNYAIDCGINYIDTAYWYGQGQSELFLGKALKNIPRDKFFIGTKVGRYESKAVEMFNFSAEKVTKSAEESLQRLQLDYVDILQIHDVEFAPSIDVIVNETLPAIDHLRKRGLCRFVGITGYPIDALREVLERSTVTIDSALSYCRLTLWDPSLIEHFSYFQSKGVPLINASPIGMGLLASAPLQPWHPASDEIKQACVQAVKYCEEEGVNISRLAIHYATKFKEVTTTLVSMNDRDLVDKNIEAALCPLSLKEQTVMNEIMQLYLNPLKQKHWEGVELEQYQRELQQIKQPN